MPQLSAQQNLAQGASWQTYAAALQSYQSARSQDPDFDNVTAMHWTIDALQTSKQYYLSAINAAYASADQAFAKLDAATAQANTFVAALTNDAKSWNQFATAASAMEKLVTALEPPFNPVAILGAADGVLSAVKPTAKP